MTQQFEITASIQTALQAIIQSRLQIASLALSNLQSEQLRLRARVRAAHFTAWLDGYSLSGEEAGEVLIDGHRMPGREGDSLQLKRAYQALEQVEAWVESKSAIDEKNLRQLHAILAAGRKSRPSTYRTDPAIPGRMNSLLGGLGQPPASAENIVLQAGLAEYEINRLQPFARFNARLGRMLATWVLYRGGYPLLHSAALEEAFAADLPAYQAAAALTDATTWLEYFTARLAAAYAEAALQVSQLAGHLASQMPGQAASAPGQPVETGTSLPRPDARLKRVLRLFETQTEISAKDVMRVLGLPPKPAGELLESWQKQGWLALAGKRYRMSGELKQNFQQLVEQDD